MGTWLPIHHLDLEGLLKRKALLEAELLAYNSDHSDNDSQKDKSIDNFDRSPVFNKKSKNDIEHKKSKNRSSVRDKSKKSAEDLRVILEKERRLEGRNRKEKERRKLNDRQIEKRRKNDRERSRDRERKRRSAEMRGRN